MAVYRQDIDFQSLFRKLGHQLEEIRVRALDNINSKLEHQLICEQDIIHERHLIIRLLEWFNFTPCSKREDVLRLLCRLSQHWGAAELIQGVGGIEFLSQLREDVEASLQPVIDQILENVMRLPDAKGQEHAPECIYHKPADSAAWGNTLTSVDENHPSHASLTTAASASHVSSLPSVTAEKLGRHDIVSEGYFQGRGDSEASPRPQPDLRPEQNPVGFKMSTFPWLPLTRTDRYVLQSTNRSLQSREVSVLTSACEFLSDVAFQDFPAEIFLQRPLIVRSLLGLMGVGQTGDPQLVVCAARTLSHLCTCLQTRIRFYQDPVLYTPKQDFSSSSPSTFSLTGSSSSHSVHSSDTRPSLIGWSDKRHRGDGRDGDSSDSSRDSSVGPEPPPHGTGREMDVDDTDNLQYLQLPLPQFAATVLLQSLQSLRTMQQSVSTELLRLGFEAWKILVVVVAEDLWNSGSESAKEQVSKLKSCMETCSALLNYHHHHRPNKSNMAAGAEDHGDGAHHRHVYLGVASLLSHLLHLLPHDKAVDIIPEQLHDTLGSLLFDESLAVSYPQCHGVLAHYAQLLDLDTYRHFCQAVHVRQSMQDTCCFVLQAKAKTLPIEEAVAMADSAVISLPYHLHLPFVTEFVAFFSHLSSRQSSDKALLSHCTGTLLKLLSHPLTEVRQHTYFVLFSTIQSCLNPANEAANTNLNSHLGAKFVLNTDVLYEIICFGLADSDNKVSSLAKDLVFHLLQSQLLLGDLLWGELISALLKSLPVLQSYADLKSRFGRRLWAMLDPAVTSDHLCLMDKLRGNLRLMLSADAGLREEVMKRLCWFLVHESDSTGRLPRVSDLDVPRLSTLFIVDTPRYLDDDSARSVFQVDGMKQVYDIFTANPVDPGVKKSAAEQLAIMMQDPHLHAAFRQSGGLEVILSVLHEAVERPSQGDQHSPSLAVVPACVRMLRHLLHHDYTLRHSLTHDPHIYHDLVRVSIVLVREESLSYQVAHILTLLLFDEVAKFDISCNQKGQADKSFSLPAVVTKRYRLPFRPTVHHTVSPSAILAPPEHDALKLPAPKEMLRVVWNVAWCGGLDNLLQLLKTGGSKLEDLRDFSRAMLLTDTDRAVLTSSGLRYSLQEGVYAVANAVSHASVVSGLNGLLAVMATIPSAECVTLFNQLSWSDVIHRFLQVTPSSPQDENLLLEVLRFINVVISMTSQLPEQITQWLAQRLYDSTGPLMALLNTTPSSGSGEGKDSPDTSLTGKRSLNKLSLQFITTFISRLPYRLHTRVSVSQKRGELIHKLLLHLNVSDAPHFYNLAALEGILVCMMHLTARPGWSEEGSDMEPAALCSHVLNCLLEVVSAFHIGRGSTSMSYIGRGVTKAATLCLRHLAHEMVIHTENKEWAKNWLYSRQGADAEAEPGLNWMLTLWAYRDAEVRAAGLGIAVALTSSEVGRMLVTNNCRHIPGGIWGAAFSVLLDPSECSAVRQQAALLLVNLTSQTIPTITLDSPSPSSPSVWQGPVVMDVESNVSLVGLNALLALLHHSHFYHQLSAMLASFFSSSVLQPVLVTTQVPLHSLDSSHSSLSSSVCSTDRYRQQREDSSQPMDQEPAATSARSTGESGHSGGSHQDSHVSATTSSSGTTHTGLQLDSTSSSSSRGEGGGGGEGADLEGMNSVVTPCLVAAVTQLLGNLVVMAPEDTFRSLAAHNVLDTLLSMIDTSLLQDLCRQLLSGPHRGSSLLTLRDLLRMYDAVVSLLRTCVVMNSPTRMALLANKGALKAIASLMLLQCDSGGDVVRECRQLWLSVVKLLCSLLQTQSAAALHTLSHVLAPLWIDFCDALVHLMEIHSKETEELFMVVTSFLSLLLTEEGKQAVRDPQRCNDSATFTYLLDVSKAKCRKAADKDGERTHFTTGASLAKVLVSAFELTLGSKVGSKGRVSGQALQVINTLKSLLAVSQSAKLSALDMGLVELLMDNLKEIHAHLSLESLHLSKASRKKDDGVLQELIFTVNILRNLICGNEQAKLACRHSGLGAVVHKLWAWCLQEPSLMSPILSLLINFTARCPAAATSLASAASGLVTSSASRQQLINNSLVLAVTKATQREVERELTPSSSGSPHLKLFFTLLTSLSLSAECRNLIWKSTILQDFSKLSPNRSRKSRSRQMLDGLWLELAVGLSFSTDGQQMLLRIDDCLTVLLDFLENGFASPHCQECAMLVLRNMCCHAANKPKLLANENVIPCCVDVVESSDNSRLQTLAASALWALAYNNHKAKVAMKGVNIEARMRACLKSVQSLGHSMEDVQCSENIQAVISTITT